MRTNDEVAIKLVSQSQRTYYHSLLLDSETDIYFCFLSLFSRKNLPFPFLQEPLKAKRPQLPYESKLYRVLQGGGR